MWSAYSLWASGEFCVLFRKMQLFPRYHVPEANFEPQSIIEVLSERDPMEQYHHLKALYQDMSAIITEIFIQMSGSVAKVPPPDARCIWMESSKRQGLLLFPYCPWLDSKNRNRHLSGRDLFALWGTTGKAVWRVCLYGQKGIGPAGTKRLYKDFKWQGYNGSDSRSAQHQTVTDGFYYKARCPYISLFIAAHGAIVLSGCSLRCTSF